MGSLGFSIWISSVRDLASWWRHQMEHFPRYWPFVRGIHRSPVNSTHKGQWRGALMFSLICAGINSWVNNREAGDLRRHRAHYDLSVMLHYNRDLNEEQNMELFKIKCKGMLEKHYVNKWQTEIMDHEKHFILRTYITYKTVYEMEPYLYLVKILNRGLRIQRYALAHTNWLSKEGGIHVPYLQ